MDTLTDDGLNKKKKTLDSENKVTLNDINQLKARIKSVGITFNEMSIIQVEFCCSSLLRVHSTVFRIS
jgi:hypothetical protein